MATVTINRITGGIKLTLADEAGTAHLTLTDEERVNLAFALLEVSE